MQYPWNSYYLRILNPKPESGHPRPVNIRREKGRCVLWSDRSSMIELEYWMIRRGMSSHGGWNAQQLATIGVPWPPMKGWIRRVAGTKVRREDYERFLAMKDAHIHGHGSAIKKVTRAQMKVIKQRARELVTSPFGSNLTTCANSQCAYPACLCGITKPLP